jgi:hypothetical protein
MEVVMRIIVSLTLGTLLATPAFAQAEKVRDQDCQTIWRSALGNSNSDLDQAAAQKHVTNFKSVDTNSDGKISATEWSAGCMSGYVKTTSSAGSDPAGETSDRTPGKPAERTPNSTTRGAAGTDAGQTPEGTSDRTPEN